MQPGQVLEQGLEPVVRRTGRGLGAGEHLVGRGRRRGDRQAPMPVVLTVDPDRLEVRRQALDLAQEVDCVEPPLPQCLWQGVAGGGDAHTGLDEPRQQARDEDRVAGVIQLELVDGQQPVPGQRLDGPGEAERPDKVGELDERAIRPGLGCGMPQRSQQMGLADPEAPIEVDAGPASRDPGPAETPLSRRREPLGEVAEPLGRGLLRRLPWVGQVGLEAHPVEPGWGHHRCHQRLGGHHRPAVDQTQRHDCRP